MLQSSQRLSSNSQSQKSGGSKKRRSSQQDSQPPPRQYVLCPICTAQIPLTHLACHAEECRPKSRSSEDREPVMEPAPDHHEDVGQEEESLHDEQIPASSNAFDVMMQQQRKNSETVTKVFSLEHSSETGWRWHWYSKKEAEKEASTIKWSAATSVNQEGGRGKGSSPTVNILLSTNIPTSSKGVDWTTEGLLSNHEVPPEGRWQAGNGFSVIKSVLQKAVRLGRAPCAVRILLHLYKVTFLPDLSIATCLIMRLYSYIGLCSRGPAKTSRDQSRRFHPSPLISLPNLDHGSSSKGISTESDPR